MTLLVNPPRDPLSADLFSVICYKNRPTVSPAKNSLAYCHINDFQRASRLARPFQGGEKMTAVWASHHEELCSAGVVAPHVHTHMVAPHRWGGLDGGNPLGSAVDASRRPSMGRPLPH